MPGGSATERINGRGRKEAAARRARLRAAIWLLLPSAVAVLLVLALMQWHMQTQVEIDSIVKRVRFRSLEDSPQVLLESATARSAALRGFAEVRFSPAAISIADPARYDVTTDSYPEAAWTVLPLQPSMVLRAAGPAATVTIQPARSSGGPVRLNRVFVSNASVTLESPERGTLQVRIRGSRQAVPVSPPDEFRLVADYCTNDREARVHRKPSATLRVRLRPDARFVEAVPDQSGILIALDTLPEAGESLLTKAGIGVTQVEFLDQGSTGRPETALTGPGKIRYTEYDVPDVVLSASDFLILENLRGFRLLECLPAAEEGSLHIKLRGAAGKMSSGPFGFLQNRRLTGFDMLWHSRTLTVLFVIMVWLVPTLAAGRRFYREMVL